MARDPGHGSLDLENSYHNYPGTYHDISRDLSILSYLISEIDTKKQYKTIDLGRVLAMALQGKSSFCLQPLPPLTASESDPGL